MLFREHRGGLEDSMKTAVELAGRAALVKHCHDLLYNWYVDVKDEDLEVVLYMGYLDKRIGWAKTYIVTVKGYGVIGMTDSPC